MTYQEITAKLAAEKADTAPLTDAIKTANVDPDDLYWDMFDAGTQYDEDSHDPRQCNDVIGWATEQDSINDDGEKAVVRVLLVDEATA